MDNSHIEDTLDEVQELFNRNPRAVETGLDVDDPATLQLRKACRLLESARHLQSENGYYTVVIETSFAAIERTLQFYLVKNGFLSPEEYIGHREVYERSHEIGLYKEFQGEADRPVEKQPLTLVLPGRGRQRGKSGQNAGTRRRDP